MEESARMKVDSQTKARVPKAHQFSYSSDHSFKPRANQDESQIDKCAKHATLIESQFMRLERSSTLIFVLLWF